MSGMGDLLEESVARLLGDMVDDALLLRCEDEGLPEALWAAISEQGVPDTLVPQDLGGVGATWLDAYGIARAAGRHAAPVPLVEMMLVRYLAGQAGCTGAVADAGIAGLLPRALSPGELSGDALTARIEAIPWGRDARCFAGLVAAGEEVQGGAELVIVDASNIEVGVQRNIGREPRDDVAFGASPVLARVPIDLPADAALWLGALLRSAQVAGAGAGVLDLAVEHTSQREQFGRPLSKFQAVQHHLAALAGAVASVDSVAMAASAALDQRGLGVGAGRKHARHLRGKRCRRRVAA